MICPNCTREMKDESYEYYGIGSWDMDYPDNYQEQHVCTCGVKIINGKWEIPESIRATDKQIHAAEVISKVLGLRTPPPLKTLMWKFIHDHIEESKEKSKAESDCNAELFFEENYSWLPEYY